MSDPHAVFDPRLQALVDAGFDVRERAGRWWLRFPDGFDSEVIDADALATDAAIAAMVARLLRLASRRAEALARARDAFGQSGWGLDEHPGGHWAAGCGGMSTSVNVGWTLTERLRDGDVTTALQEEMGGHVALHRPLLSPPPDTAALWQAHLRAREQFEGPRDDDDVDDDEEQDDFVSMPPRSPAAVGRARREAARIVEAAPTAAAMDAWVEKRLAMLRRDVGTRVGTWRLRDRLWRTGDADWLDRATCLALCHAGVEAHPWDTASLLVLHELGAADAHARALAAWDDWKQHGGYDADSFGFDDLTALVHRDRPAARKLLFDDDHVRQQRRGFEAGFANALHAVRAGLLQDLDALANPASERRRRIATFSLAEALDWAGPQAAPLVLDPAEADALRVAVRDELARCVQGASAGQYFMEPLLRTTAAFGWREVALDFMRSGDAMFLLGDFDNYQWITPYLAEGLLALSALTPGPECAELARLAQPRVSDRAMHRRNEDADAVAIAWWRSRRAMAG